VGEATVMTIQTERREMGNQIRSRSGLRTALVVLGLLRALLGLGHAAFAQGQKIIFLHHSCGENLIAQGGVREGLTALGYEFYDHGYNDDGLTLADGTRPGTNFDVPGDNTDPDGLAAIFAQPLHDPPDNTFSHLMQYDVIGFKSCFPVSNIGDDDELAQYKSYYLSIRDTLDQHPEKTFVIVTQPPQVPASSDPSEAARARAFVDWLQSDEYLSGYPNIFVFDFFDLLAGDDNFLRPEYRGDEYDAHPNELANQTIGPLFVDFIDQAIRSHQAGGPPPVVPTTPPSGVVQTPQPVTDAPPVVPAATNLIDDFESYGPGESWDTWSDEGGTTIQCTTSTEKSHGGIASLRIEYSISADGWAGCGRSFDTPQNWEGASGLSMWLHAAEAGQGAGITLQLGDPEDPTPFQASLDTPSDSVGGWAVVELPWDNFTKPDWYGEGGLSQFDASRVVGMSFDFVGLDDSGSEGVLWADDISLSGQVAQPQSPPTVSSQEGKGTGGICGGICPLPTLSVPLGAVGVIYWRRVRSRSGR
jgi:hypothetical protein